MAKYQNMFKTKRTSVARSFPLAALMLMVISAIVGYLGSEIALPALVHPIHWVATGISALFGFLAGMLIVERFGDIF